MSWASLGTAGTSATRPGAREKPYHRSINTTWDTLLPTLRPAPTHTHSPHVGGNKLYHALRLDMGNFSWGSECCTHKARVTDVVYSASNSEPVGAKTLMRSCVVLNDNTPDQQR